MLLSFRIFSFEKISEYNCENLTSLNRHLNLIKYNIFNNRITKSYLFVNYITQYKKRKIVINFIDTLFTIQVSNFKKSIFAVFSKQSRNSLLFISAAIRL